jgi:hypothetical protein
VLINQSTREPYAGAHQPPISEVLLQHDDAVALHLRDDDFFNSIRLNFCSPSSSNNVIRQPKRPSFLSDFGRGGIVVEFLLPLFKAERILLDPLMAPLR